MKLQEIEIKKLEVDKYNVRKGEWTRDEELIDSIKSLGVLEPLLVRPLRKGIKLSIVCGSRRWNAATEAKLKTVPCVVKEMTDLEALGTSLQENIQRNSLDSVQEAEAIADMWELMNGEKTSEQKMKEINKLFGLSKTTIYDYLSLSRLSSTIKKMIPHGGIGVRSAVSIENSDWDKDEKEEVAEIISEINSDEETKMKVLSKMKEYDKELSPSEAFEKVKSETKIMTYRWRPRYLNTSKAMDKASKKWELGYDGVIDKCVTERLKKEGWL